MCRSAQASNDALLVRGKGLWANAFQRKTDTVMEGSKIGYQDRLIAMFRFSTRLKEASSMKLHRDLDITQKSAWLLAHSLRDGMAYMLQKCDMPFAGPVGVDEIYVGGKRQNMGNSKRMQLEDPRRGPLDKTAVVGARHRAINQAAAKVVQAADKATLQRFVRDKGDPGAKIYRDDTAADDSLPLGQETLKHSLSEYVRRDVRATGIESLQLMLKRAHKVVLHKFSPQGLDYYVQVSAECPNVRKSDTIGQMQSMCPDVDGERLRYKALIPKNELQSGARA